MLMYKSVVLCNMYYAYTYISSLDLGTPGLPVSERPRDSSHLNVVYFANNPRHWDGTAGIGSVTKGTD